MLFLMENNDEDEEDRNQNQWDTLKFEYKLWPFSFSKTILFF